MTSNALALVRKQEAHCACTSVPGWKVRSIPVIRVTFSLIFSRGFMVGVNSRGLTPTGICFTPSAISLRLPVNFGIPAAASPGKNPRRTTPIGT